MLYDLKTFIFLFDNERVSLNKCVKYLSSILSFCSVMYESSNKKMKEKDFNPNGRIYPSYFGGAWNKIYFEKMCEYYSKISKTKFTVIRHSNVYGPYDKFDLDKSHLCSATIKKVLDDNMVISIIRRLK